MNFETLENWQGSFTVTEMMDLSRWERYRDQVRHPVTLFSPADIARARQAVTRHPWAETAFARLQERVQSLGAITPSWVQTYVPRTTPGTPSFTMCPKCEFAPMHGAYDWSPDDPEHICCKGCGTVYPNTDYPEDIVFHSRFDPEQVITYYGGKSWTAYGYAAIHSSFSGKARMYQCRHAANAAEDLALMYALSGQAKYARATTRILTRFADVHPRYLVHCDYGEYADMDPRTAASCVTTLPTEEWCPPGNQPDRALYSGYWTAMRWGSSGGMEGTSLQKLILAYDLVASTLSDDERRHIERDLLLDAAVMLFSSDVINNKTGMNRCAVGLIGMVCGDPLLVRFGLDGFVRAVRDWWLPDGGTPESIGYAGMMLHGIWRMAEALQHYRDPAGVDLGPGPLQGINLYDWPRYRAVWQGMVRPLLPDGEYPLLADNRTPCHLSAMFSDILARNYPDENHYRIQQQAAQSERCYAGRIAQFWFGANLDTTAAFFREPQPTATATPALQSNLGSHLKIGTLRTGKDGRHSAISLSAAEWYKHHHYDHLNLHYWKNGREWLTDLGYLWDMDELGAKTRRTFAHNLVLVDQKEQRGPGRRGTFHLFHTSPDFSVMEASSNASGAKLHQRTIAVIGSGPTEYVVDIFRIRGGRTHDWVMHGPNQNLTLSNLNIASTDQTLYDLTDLQVASRTSAWMATWRAGRRSFSVHVPASPAETVFVGQGFGQRQARDAGATIPYLVRRSTQGASLFVTVYAEGKTVKQVRTPWLDEKDLGVFIEIETTQGTDRIISAGPGRAPGTLQIGRRKIACDGRFAFAAANGATTLIGGTHLKLSKTKLNASASALQGPVLATYVRVHESGFVTHGDLPKLSQLIGRHICVTEAKGIVRSYPVLGLTQQKGKPVLITRRGNEGYDIRAGKTWSAWCVHTRD